MNLFWQLLLLLAHSQKTSSNMYANLPFREDVINERTGGCVPSEVCHNLDINTIPYILGHVSPGFVTDRKHSLYDQAKTRHCLRGKNILILGDSVSEEMTFDLATLISGVGRYHEDFNEVIIEKGGGVDYRSNSVVLKVPRSRTTLYFNHGRRNSTIYDEEDDIYVRHRFTGHPRLSANKMGMQTFFDEVFDDELDCLLGFSEDDKRCPKPDTIIFNSGLHDPTKTPEDFDQFGDLLSQLIKNWKRQYAELHKGNVNFIFKGNLNLGTDHVALTKLNDISKTIMNHFDLAYVDISNVTSYVPRYSKYLMYPQGGTRMYSPDGHHFGAIARQERGAEQGIGTISMLITQMVLQELCDNLTSKRISGEYTYGLIVKPKEWEEFGKKKVTSTFTSASLA